MQVCSRGTLTAASIPLFRGEKWAAMLPSSCLKGKGLIYLLREIRREQTCVAVADMGSPGKIPSPYLHFLSFCRRLRSDYRVLQRPSRHTSMRLGRRKRQIGSICHVQGEELFCSSSDEDPPISNNSAVSTHYAMVWLSNHADIQAWLLGPSWNANGYPTPINKSFSV